MIFEIQKRFGSWFLFAGSLLLFFSSSFTGTVSGMIYITAGGIVFLTDPVLYYLGIYKTKIAYDLKYNLVYASMASALAVFYARFLIHVPAEGGATAYSVKNILLIIIIFLYIFSVMFRFSLYLLQESREETGGAAANRGKYMMETLYSVLIALLLFLIVNYLGAVKNPSLDLSPGYYSFGENSKTIIRSLDRDVKIYAFLPVQQASSGSSRNTGSPALYRIAEDIKVFLEQLPAINGRIEVEFINADLEAPQLIDFPSVGNGTIVFRVYNKDTDSGSLKHPYTERRIQIATENDMETIERESVRSLIQVSSSPKKLYMTSLNGERKIESEKILAIDGMNIFKNMLSFYNFQSFTLDHKNGWPGSIPDDCDVLMILGPTVPLSGQAKTAIMEYLKKGGRVFIAIDPAGREDFSWLLKNELQIPYEFKSDFITNVNNFPGTPITDLYGKHRITENLSAVGKNIVLFPSAGYFLKNQNMSPGALKSDTEFKSISSVEIVMTLSGSFLDRNKNGVRDAGEDSGNYVLGLAVENEKLPLLAVFSGVNWISNAGMGFPVANKNAILAADTLFWMTESRLAADIPPEKRDSRSIQITDDLKFRNMMLGMVLFPFATIIFSLSGVYFYRKKRSG